MKLCRMKQTSFLKLLCGTTLIWLIITFSTSANLWDSIDSAWFSMYRRNLDDSVLEQLMRQPDNVTVSLNPLLDLFLWDEGILQFYHLPHRLIGRRYTEVTSAHRDGVRLPLAPDFSFHSRYFSDHVTIFEDVGPGCIYRIFLYPNLTDDATRLLHLTNHDLKKLFLRIDLDGKLLWFNLENVAKADQWPFIAPISSQHSHPMTGVASYMPFCYQHSVNISFHPVDPLPLNLLQLTVNCSSSQLHCPVRIYSAVSAHHFVPKTQLISFGLADEIVRLHHMRISMEAVRLLKKPDMYGPDNAERCLLSCWEICSTCKQVVYEKAGRGVISTIKVRVLLPDAPHEVMDWTSLRLTAEFDGHVTIDAVPLGSIFGAVHSLNDFRGASLGRTRRRCAYVDLSLNLPAVASTGYSYFPMPFWKKAHITVSGTEFQIQPLLLCTHISEVPNYYTPLTTGYFHVLKSDFEEHVETHRVLLHLIGEWGHLVGLMVEIERLRPKRYGSERWPALQADPVIYVDSMKSATVLGTGLEDYFSYAHGFRTAENSTYAFVGAHHVLGSKESLTAHAYRLHLLDPIPFHHELKILMEGVNPRIFSDPLSSVKPDTFSRKRMLGSSMIGHVLFYYSRKRSRMIVCDVLTMAELESESDHHLDLLYLSPVGRKGKTFHRDNVQFLGNAYSDEPITVRGRAFSAQDRYSFHLKLCGGQSSLVLRRTFYSRPFLWNQEAEVRLDGFLLTKWLIPMGSLDEEYSLKQDDLDIPFSMVANDVIVIEIIPKTDWTDISYALISTGDND